MSFSVFRVKGSFLRAGIAICISITAWMAFSQDVPRSSDQRMEETFILPPSKSQLSQTTESEQGKESSVSTPFDVIIAYKKRNFKGDVICPDCRHAEFPSKTLCSSKMKRLMSDSPNMTIIEAATAVSKEGNQSLVICKACDPDSCGGHGYYLPFDEAAPTVQYATTHYLKSVPSQCRLPSNVTKDWNAYLSNPSNTYPNKLHLFEYNPSIAVLPESYRESLGDIAAHAKYVASYRISHVNQCLEYSARIRLYGGSWETLQSVPTTDYLGIALLDEDLKIMVDTVVTLKNQRQKIPAELKQYRQAVSILQDYRLFRMQETIYLSFGTFVTPLYLSPTGDKPTEESHQPIFNLHKVFPSVASSSFDVWIRTFPSCAVYGDRIFIGSKNVQYFVDGNGLTMMDHFPTGNPHDVRLIDLQVECGQQNITYYVKQKVKDIPAASFGTMEELQFPFLKRGQALFTTDRGSACCVTIKNPHSGESFLVGVSHPKTVYPGERLPKTVVPNTYFSRFYAFEMQSPYRNVARTGKFCLGYAQKGDSSSHPIWNLQESTVTATPMLFDGKLFDCPRIHFVTGISEKWGDPSKIILAYGVSDCLSRFVELDKSEIAALLWDPALLR